MYIGNHAIGVDVGTGVAIILGDRVANHEHDAKKPGAMSMGSAYLKHPGGFGDGKVGYGVHVGTGVELATSVYVFENIELSV
jgi:hypothetical protein